MTTGSQVGALLVDGLGDGVAVSCPTQDLSFLRNMSFGVLQGSRMRNTKTGVPPHPAPLPPSEWAQLVQGCGQLAILISACSFPRSPPHGAACTWLWSTSLSWCLDVVSLTASPSLATAQSSVNT